MPRLLAVSPHLDDAIFSAGGTLALRARQGWEVTIATCFTASVPDPQGFALACQLDKGLDADVDYMALRRDEDVQACAAIGALPTHLPFAEASHRGYDNAPALFAARLPHDDIATPLAADLRALVDTLAPDLVLAPAGIGGHVDHLVAIDALAQAVRSTLMWEDWPYADRADRTPFGDIAIELDDAAWNAKRAACLCYGSQLGFQFGGPAALTRRLQATRIERFAKQDPARA